MTETSAESGRSRRDRAMDRVTEGVDSAVDSARVGIDRATDFANKHRDDVEDFAKEKPLLALGVALLLGIGIGAIFTAAVSGRRSRD